MYFYANYALFSGNIYTAGTNFTRLLVVTVATNLNFVTRMHQREEFDCFQEEFCLSPPVYMPNMIVGVVASSWVDHF